MSKINADMVKEWFTSDIIANTGVTMRVCSQIWMC
jgi:hypothetical protein